jgi:two-component system, chemotaxis family, protein-glutamate methylesterase/glutaminase
MAVKVLVVDDSGFFRRRVSEILSADPNIQVIGTATNGREAIEQAQALKPDVITMDYEMPMMASRLYVTSCSVVRRRY